MEIVTSWSCELILWRKLLNCLPHQIQARSIRDKSRDGLWKNVNVSPFQAMCRTPSRMRVILMLKNGDYQPLKIKKNNRATAHWWCKLWRLRWTKRRPKKTSLACYTRYHHSLRKDNMAFHIISWTFSFSTRTSLHRGPTYKNGNCHWIPLDAIIAIINLFVAPI